MLERTIRHALALLALSCTCILSNAQTNVDFNAYRAKMGGEKDARLVFKAIMDEYKGTDDLTVTFRNERYDFYAEGPAPENYSCPGLDIVDRKGVTIDGNGAEFVFHGIMGISSIIGSENVTLKNFTVDWDRPIMAQGEIVDMADDHLDIRIDSKEYSYRVSGERLHLSGEGWERPLMSMFENVFDSNGDILYGTSDGTICSGGLYQAPVEPLGNDVLRFHVHPKSMLPEGSIIALIFGHQITTGIWADRSKDLKLENLTLYHSMGVGVFCNFCENITETNVKIIPNRAKGRVFSTERDANHFNCCKGLIHFDGCEGSGQEDDFVNVHSRYYNITGITGPRSVSVINGGRWRRGSLDFAPGETVAFLLPSTGQREYTMTVDRVNENEVFFKEDLPSCIDTGYYLENCSWTASFIFENCRVLKGNRARGILFTTSQPVIIRNNYFHSAGTAILIEGDIGTWYEACACSDVDIYGNVFDNCITSRWGDGVITVTPSHRPADADAPTYHRNIKIHNNEFRVFDTSIMRACSVDGLKFTKNKIVRTYDYKPYLPYKDSFTLEGCRNVVIKGNRIDNAYEIRSVGTKLMNLDEVKVSRQFTVH